MSICFDSLFGEDISSYLQYKRALGRKFDNEEKALKLLDRYLVDQNLNNEVALQPALIDSFLASRPRNKPRSYNHLLGVTRCFFDWLVTQDRLKFSPVKAEPRRTTSQERPFLFEPSQIAELLSLTAQLPDNQRALHRSDIYILIFILMYG